MPLQWAKTIVENRSVGMSDDQGHSFCGALEQAIRPST
jgi:hypothetical protein